MSRLVGRLTFTAFVGLGGAVLAYCVWNALYRVWEDSVLEGYDLTWSSILSTVGLDIWLLGALGLALVGASALLRWRQ